MITGLDATLPLLCCPACRAPLTRADRVVGCGSGHRFDIARQGYVTLLGPGSRTDTGDTADMVAARQDFLDTGHFAPLTAAIVAAAGAGPVLDLGAGTGHHLRAVIGSDPAAVGLAIDSSRYAARRAGRAHPRIGAVVADAWSRLPVRDAAVGTVLSVFAPRDPAEVARMLRPDGRAVIVTPLPEHLAELRERVELLAVDPGKAAAVRARLVGLTRVGHTEIRHEMRLTRDDADRVIRMGPSAYHLPAPRRSAAIAGLGELTPVTLAVTISVFETSCPL